MLTSRNQECFASRVSAHLCFFSDLIIFVRSRDVLLLLLCSIIARSALMLAQNFIDPFSVLIGEPLMGPEIIENSNVAFHYGSDCPSPQSYNSYYSLELSC